MAKYRQIHTSFWQDGFVLKLTPEEKYFYLYLMTNTKTSQCGIYELPIKIIEIETGYNQETVQKLLKRFIEYKKVDYHEPTEEIMMINWIKYNPPNNSNVIKRTVYELNSVKCERFVSLYLSMCEEYSEFDTEGLIRGLQGAYKGLPSNRIKNKEEGIKNKEEAPPKPSKKSYAEYVKMTEDEYSKLINEYSETLIKEKIIDLNLWKGSKGKETKSDYMTLLNWIRKDIKEGKINLNQVNQPKKPREIKFV